LLPWRGAPAHGCSSALPATPATRGKLRFQNSAFVLSPGGEIVGKYSKVHLVPYGEYVPLRPLFPFIEKLTVGVGDFLAGTGFERS